MPPATNGDDKKMRKSYCPNRATLLAAMSGGGRHGFDAPFTPSGTTNVLFSPQLTVDTETSGKAATTVGIPLQRSA